MNPEYNTIVISDDEEPRVQPRADPRASHPAYKARRDNNKVYDEHRDEAELLAETDDELEEDEVLYLDSSDEEYLGARVPPTPRWQREHEDHPEEAENDAEFVDISDDDEPMPERPPTPGYREHTPEPPAYRSGVTRGQVFEEIHQRRVITEGNRRFREWHATFRTELAESTDRTVATIPTPARPESEPIVEFPADPEPTEPAGPSETATPCPHRSYHLVPRDRWPQTVRSEVEDVLRRQPKGRTRFCRFADGYQYLVRMWKGRTVVERRPRK